MAVLVENFRSGTITSSISNVDTTISSAEFADLGVVASPDTMKIVLDPQAVDGDPEIVTITTHTSSSTSITVTRSGGRAHNADTKWVHSTLAEDYQRIGFEGAASFDSVSVTVDPDSGTEDFNLVPSGTVVMYAGGTAPTGWLVCDGSAISRTTYSRLFTAIGTRYGVGDGSTTFNLPNPVDRVAMGIALSTTPSADTLSVSSSLDSLSLGDQSANHNHSISSNAGNQSASHSHTITSNAGNQSASHSHAANTGFAGAHTHNLSNNSAGHSHSYTKPNGSSSNANTGTQSANHTHNTSTQGAHDHNFNTGNQSASHTHTITSNAGNQSSSHSHSISSNAGSQSANHNHDLSSSSISSNVDVEPFGFIIKT